MGLKRIDRVKSATFGSFNLELLMTEALFSLIVRKKKKIRCFLEIKPKVGALPKDKKITYNGRDLLTKQISYR